MGKRARVFEIMQYATHPVTGERLFGEEDICNGLEHKSIKQWAWICHDKDKYVEEDHTKYLAAHGSEPKWKIGDLKPKHWHIVLSCPNNIDIDYIAKWFHVPVNFVEVPFGRGAFLDKVQYLTHEDEKQQALGKTRYSDEEIHANFDFRAALSEREEKRVKFGGDISKKQENRHRVLHEGLSIIELSETDPLAYEEDFATLDKFRKKYLSDYAEMPLFRYNYYVEGGSGSGKNTVSEALARALFPDVEQPFFTIGGGGVSFDGYDGQPVIIWNDRRSKDFFLQWSRGEVFDIFDTHPTDAKHHIKYGDVRLLNRVNIVNGIESYKDFLDGLAGEYSSHGEVFKAEDKSQSYRRFPIVIRLHEEDFDVLLNHGVVHGTREFQQYDEYKSVMGSFARVVKNLDGKAKDIITKRMVQPILDATKKVLEIEEKKITDTKLIPDDIQLYGLSKEDYEKESKIMHLLKFAAEMDRLYKAEKESNEEYARWFNDAIHQPAYDEIKDDLCKQNLEKLYATISPSSEEEMEAFYEKQLREQMESAEWSELFGHEDKA